MRITCRDCGINYDSANGDVCACRCACCGGEFDSTGNCPSYCDGDPVTILKKRIKSKSGLCTCISISDKENAACIRFILDTYFSKDLLEFADRVEDDWEILDHLPTNFSTYRYRVIQ